MTDLRIYSIVLLVEVPNDEELHHALAKFAVVSRTHAISTGYTREEHMQHIEHLLSG